MFVVMAAIGVIIILLGLITCTEWVDNHYRNRRPKMQAMTQPDINEVLLWYVRMDRKYSVSGPCRECGTDCTYESIYHCLCFYCTELSRVTYELNRN